MQHRALSAAGIEGWEGDGRSREKERRASERAQDALAVDEAMSARIAR